MVPRKHLQEHRCMNMKHYIFQAVCFLIGADSFMTEVIITQWWWVTKAHIFLSFNHFFGTDCGSRKCGGNTPSLCGTGYTVRQTALGLPPPCPRAMSIWFELNTELFGILHSDHLSHEVNGLIANALALCERRKQQKLASLCRLQTI